MGKYRYAIWLSGSTLPRKLYRLGRARLVRALRVPHPSELLRALGRGRVGR